MHPLPGVIPITLPPEADLVPCRYAVDITDGDPREREYVFFAAPDGSFTVGLWEAQPHAENIASYAGDEFFRPASG